MGRSLLVSLCAVVLVAVGAPVSASNPDNGPSWKKPAVTQPDVGRSVPAWRKNGPAARLPASNLPASSGTPASGRGRPENQSSVASPGPKKKARFRITLNGFHVFETFSRDGNRDGRGDEVYVAAKVREYFSHGAIAWNWYPQRTRTIGDNRKHRDRLRGGTKSRTGGFRQDDEYPGVPFDEIFAGPFPASEHKLPMTVWEGELEAGGNFLTIEPVIWEDEGQSSTYLAWARKPLLSFMTPPSRDQGLLVGWEQYQLTTSRMVDMPVSASLPRIVITYENAQWLAAGCPPEEGNRLRFPAIAERYARALAPGSLPLAFACLMPAVNRNDPPTHRSGKPIELGTGGGQVLRSQAGRVYVLFLGDKGSINPLIFSSRLMVSSYQAWGRVSYSWDYTHQPTVYLLAMEVRRLSGR